MSRYINVRVDISEEQKQKLQNALQSGGPVSIHLGYEDLKGENILALTKSQVNKLVKAYESGKGITIKMSKLQVACNIKVEGGFLGAPPAFAARYLPRIVMTVLLALDIGTLSGLASYGMQKVMGNRLYLKKGDCIC
ncbi:Hypothetical predicted protein [Octopus vulgaris]|uniref:Uncharacterized protein n=1 Tax=Octopus vulgaris TaxID=6645 RepID=A0AA36EYT7_OCTVU|nr:Hypothetical predicted protein [Octopus vulgaris]